MSEGSMRQTRASFARLSSLLAVSGFFAASCLAFSTGCSAHSAPHPPSPSPSPPPRVVPGSPVDRIRGEAKALEPQVHVEWVRDFLRATAELPAIPPRVLFQNTEKTRWYSETEASQLPDETRRTLVRRDFDEEYYYNTRYGTPLAYARPLEILGEAGFQPAGRKILDFGYGGIGQLRLLASLGADVCGVEVDPVARALYGEPGDQGPVRGRRGISGSLRLVDGRFPADEAVVAAVGEGYDLVISKNTLKRGYIHPEQPVPDRQRVLLGVDDPTYLQKLLGILKPGGRVLIYNLCPAPAPPGKPYIPWADGRSPFTTDLFAMTGFHVLVFDRDDSEAARAMGHALGWDTGDSPMDLQKDLFALYTLVERSL